MKIRPVLEKDMPFLWDMLYESIFYPEGEEKPCKEELLNVSHISAYLQDFGLIPSDFGFIVEDENNNQLGAGWYRIIKLCGNLCEGVPEICMSVVDKYRNKGIGTIILKSLKEKTKAEGYKVVSLGVEADNPVALHLYKKEGFEIAKTPQENYFVMKFDSI